MSSAEFTLWAAFYALEPWGYDAEMYRAALVSATTANASGRKRNGQGFRPSDFLPAKPTRSAAVGGAQTVREQRRLLDSISGVKR